MHGKQNRMVSIICDSLPKWDGRVCCEDQTDNLDWDFNEPKPWFETHGTTGQLKQEIEDTAPGSQEFHGIQRGPLYAVVQLLPGLAPASLPHDGVRLLHLKTFEKHTA